MYQADRSDETGSQRSAMRRVGPLALAAIVVALATLLLGPAVLVVVWRVLVAYAWPRPAA